MIFHGGLDERSLASMRCFRVCHSDSVMRRLLAGVLETRKQTSKSASRRFPHGLFPPGSSELRENTETTSEDKGVVPRPAGRGQKAVDGGRWTVEGAQTL